MEQWEAGVTGIICVCTLENFEQLLEVDILAMTVVESLGVMT